MSEEGPSEEEMINGINYFFLSPSKLEEKVP